MCVDYIIKKTMVMGIVCLLASNVYSMQTPYQSHEDEKDNDQEISLSTVPANTSNNVRGNAWFDEEIYNEAAACATCTSDYGARGLVTYMNDYGYNSANNNYRGRLDGTTVLHDLIIKNKPTLVYTLLKVAAARNVSLRLNELKDNMGKTPLHYAACLPNQSILELLLLEGADPNVQDNDGNTALHMVILSRPWHKSAICGSSAADLLARILITTHHANPGIKNNDGNTIYHLVALNGCFYDTGKWWGGPRYAYDYDRRFLDDSAMRLIGWKNKAGKTPRMIVDKAEDEAYNRSVHESCTIQ